MSSNMNHWLRTTEKKCNKPERALNDKITNNVVALVQSCPCYALE